MRRRVLILGGTGEARMLAGTLADGSDLTADLAVTSSLAGRVTEPLRPAGDVRIGGFGGPAGLTEWLRAEHVTAVVDATHPFAATMTTSAVSACAAAGVPLLLLRRPGWTATDADAWRRVPSLAAAAAAIPEVGERVFLTTGRQGLATFAALDGHWFLVRTVDPPGPPLPVRMRLLLARGPFTVDGELALLRTYGIDVLVTKDSGGPQTVAKLIAARELGLPVLMVDRPPTPSGVAVVSDPADAVRWLRQALGHEPPHPTAGRRPAGRDENR